MALIIRIAQFIARMNDALNEARQAQRLARRKYPFVPEE